LESAGVLDPSLCDVEILGPCGLHCMCVELHPLRTRAVDALLNHHLQVSTVTAAYIEIASHWSPQSSQNPSEFCAIQLTLGPARDRMDALLHLIGVVVAGIDDFQGLGCRQRIHLHVSALLAGAECPYVAAGCVLVVLPFADFTPRSSAADRTMRR